MTRLNYASRKSGGSELGNIVSRDLTEKFLENPRRRVLNDPTMEIHLSNNKRADQGLVVGGLADEGFEKFIQTLSDCLKSPNSFQLLELHLTCNKLTVKSLPALAKVIELSADYLRDLDLSNNEFRVEAKEEMESWENFLKSFETCSMLKRLNLGGNPLGSFGMEILAKTYIQSPLVVERDQDGNPCMKGLRSIPYLILANIDLTSSAIIYLASMLSIQQRRRKLRSYLPDTMPIVTAPEALGLCESIIWLPNENLNVEKRDFFICAAKMAIKPSRRGSDINASRMLRSPDRNALSVLHEAMAWYQAKRDYEYFRHRKDICIQALNSDGIKCSLLWRAAFTTLKAGKILLVEWRCLNEQESNQQKTYAAAARGCRDSYDQNFPRLASDDRSVHPDSQKLLDQLHPASRTIMECGISSLKCLSRIPQDHWYRNIARALRTTGLLTLDQHLQIMDFAKTWTITEKHMNSEQIAGFLNSVECLGYH